MTGRKGCVWLVTERVAGYGHLSVSKALQERLLQENPELEIREKRALSPFSPSLEKGVKRFYTTLIRWEPGLWGWLYEKEDRYCRSSLFKECSATLIAARLRHHLWDDPPQVVICTHAFAIAAFSLLKKEGLPFRLGAVITDFALNGFWVNEEVDFYLVPHEEVKEALCQRFAVQPYKVWVSGLPVGADFVAIDQDQKRALRRRLDWQEEEFTLLLCGGGGGLGSLKLIVQRLDRLPQPLQFAVIAGSNRKLYEEIRQFSAKAIHPIHLYGFTSEMPRLMQAADLLVGKAGGVSSAEALACELPMLIVDPIPGQEERNSRFLSRHGAALWLKGGVEELIPVVGELVSTALLDSLRENARRLSAPEASHRAARVVLQELAQSHPIIETIKEPR